MKLAFHHHRIDHATSLVNHGVGEDISTAGIRIDLDLADVAAVRERVGAWVELFDRRERNAIISSARDLAERNAAISPDNAKRAAGELDIFHRGFELSRGDAL